MNRVRPTLLLPLLALAACQTEKKPIIGLDEVPPGGILLGPWGEGNSVHIWPIFDLSQVPQQRFRLRLDGKDAVYRTGPDGFYDYATLYLYGAWTGGISAGLSGIPSGSHVVEVVDGAGQSWGRSAPLLISSGDGISTSSSPAPQLPGVMFTHFAGQVGSWNIDPTTQDSDPATDEIVVTNLVDEDVVVERCLVVSFSRTGCTPLGTVAPGAELLTVETLAASPMVDHTAVFIHLASDASQSFQRDLVNESNSIVNSCQMERILVHGRRPVPPDNPPSFTGFAFSSCTGYASGSGSGAGI
jgi:hypothetical protein